MENQQATQGTVDKPSSVTVKDEASSSSHDVEPPKPPKKKSSYGGVGAGEKINDLTKGTGTPNKMSRIPRPILGKRAESASRPQSSSKGAEEMSTRGLESRYKLQYKKYAQAMKDFRMMQNRLSNNKKTLTMLRAQIQEQLGKDPGDLAELKALLEMDSEESCDTLCSEPSNFEFGELENMKGKVKVLAEENKNLAEKLKSVHSYYDTQMTYIKRVREDMPQLEGYYTELMSEVSRTEQRQDDLERRLGVQAKMVEEFSVLVNQSSIQRNKLDNLQKELEVLQGELKEERSKLMNKRPEQDGEEGDTLKKLVEEQAQRQGLERSMSQLIEERAILETKYNDLKNEFDGYRDSKSAQHEENIANDLDKKREEAECLLSELQATQEALQKAEEVAASVNRARAELEAHLQQMEVHHESQQKMLLDSINTEINKKDHHISELSKQVDNLEQTLMRERNEKEDLIKFTEQMRLEDTNKEYKLLAVKNELDCLSEEKERLEEELSQARCQMEEVEHVWKEQCIGLEEQAREIEELKEQHQLRAEEVHNLLSLLDEMEGRKALHELTREASTETCGESDEEKEAPGKIDTSSSDESECRMNTDYNQLFCMLEEKKQALSRLERRLDEVERSHERCAKKRTMYEARIAKLETSLAYVPANLLST